MSDAVESSNSIDKIDANAAIQTEKTISRRKRLLRKAPDAPKRFKSAYICYVIEQMVEVKKTLADDVNVIH